MTDHTTTLRLSDEDRAFLDQLCRLAGVDSYAGAIRLAVRDAVILRGKARLPTPKLRAKILRCIRRTGTHPQTAAVSCGVTDERFTAWMDLAAVGHPDFVRLRDEMKEAEIECAQAIVNTIRRAARNPRTRKEVAEWLASRGLPRDAFAGDPFRSPKRKMH